MIVATMMVRDESDIVAANIEHHLAQGIDHIIVTDNGSVDGTADILRQYADTGRVTLLHDPIQKKQQAKVVTRMARRAHRMGAEWVVHLDADEFWVSTDQSTSVPEVLRGLPTDVGVVLAERTNLVGYGSMAGKGAEPWGPRMIWRDTHSLAANGQRILGKVAHRSGRYVRVAQGLHDAKGILGKRKVPTGELEVLHVPQRSYGQFYEKIENSGTAYAANKNPLFFRMGKHLRHDYKRLRSGELEETYRSRNFTDEQIAEAVENGRLVEDTWLRDHMESLVSGAIKPELLRAAL
ncbi:glycosyltransferase family 2 protein [Georgenia deserti]|uniref:Glycosyltransferase family 2 protein n=1 Tax=Georgenia deserti TaxID=2093781 RepID=A0ABW4L3E3_9MICO